MDLHFCLSALERAAAAQVRDSLPAGFFVRDCVDFLALSKIQYLQQCGRTG